MTRHPERRPHEGPLHGWSGRGGSHDTGAEWGAPAFPGDESDWVLSLPLAPPPATPCTTGTCEQPAALSIPAKVRRHGGIDLERPDSHKHKNFGICQRNITLASDQCRPSPSTGSTTNGADATASGRTTEGSRGDLSCTLCQHNEQSSSCQIP